jgi:hypothetical protein
VQNPVIEEDLEPKPGRPPIQYGPTPGQAPLHLEDFDLAAELPERVGALGVMDSPAPISPISGALSKISTSSPALRNSMPAASPAMQAPAISV